MKKILCLFLCVILLFLLCGCSINYDKDEPFLFYYRREVFQYHDDYNVIVPEERIVSGQTDNLHYMLTLYLAGPADETLVSPFPHGTRIFSVSQDKEETRLILSDLDNSLDDSRFSLAAACLALTCIEVAESSQVTILSGQRTLTLTRDSLLLVDDISLLPEYTEEKT